MASHTKEECPFNGTIENLLFRQSDTMEKINSLQAEVKAGFAEVMKQLKELDNVYVSKTEFQPYKRGIGVICGVVITTLIGLILSKILGLTGS